MIASCPSLGSASKPSPTHTILGHVLPLTDSFLVGLLPSVKSFSLCSLRVSWQRLEPWYRAGQAVDLCISCLGLDPHVVGLNVLLLLFGLSVLAASELVDADGLDDDNDNKCNHQPSRRVETR